MTAGAPATVRVRVTVIDAWDTVALDAQPDTPLGELKVEALRRTLRRADPPADDYELKFRGGLVLDERQTVAAAGVPQDGALIVLPRRRRPVR